MALWNDCSCHQFYETERKNFHCTWNYFSKSYWLPEQNGFYPTIRKLIYYSISHILKCIICPHNDWAVSTFLKERVGVNEKGWGEAEKTSRLIITGVDRSFDDTPRPPLLLPEYLQRLGVPGFSTIFILSLLLKHRHYSWEEILYRKFMLYEICL